MLIFQGVKFPTKKLSPTKQIHWKLRRFCRKNKNKPSENVQNDYTYNRLFFTPKNLSDLIPKNRWVSQEIRKKNTVELLVIKFLLFYDNCPFYEVICVPFWQPTEIVAGQMEKAWKSLGGFLWQGGIPCGDEPAMLGGVTHTSCAKMAGEYVSFQFLVGPLKSHEFPYEQSTISWGHWCVYLGDTNPKGTWLGIYSHIWLLPVLIP